MVTGTLTTRVPALRAPGGSRSEVEDLGAEFVTENGVGRRVEGHRAAACATAGLDHVLHVMEGVQVGAADAAGQRLDQNLPLARGQFPDFVAHQALVAPYHRPHRPTSLRTGRLAGAFLIP